MKIFIIYWPDKSLSIVSATSFHDLFWLADLEGNPMEALFLHQPWVRLESRSSKGVFRAEGELMEAIKSPEREWVIFTDSSYEWVSKDDSAKWNRRAVEKVKSPFAPKCKKD